MRGRATRLKMKAFAVTFTLTVMGRRATPLIMKGFPVIFALTLTSVLTGWPGEISVPHRPQGPLAPP